MPLDRALPNDEHLFDAGYGSEQLGLSVYSGERYGLHFHAFEDDGNPATLQSLGDAEFSFDEGSGWGNGSHALRGVGRGDEPDGDFVVNVRIGRTPLANLVAQLIEINDKPGSTDKVLCSQFVNAGLGDVGPFDVTVRIDGGTPPGGKERIPGIEKGKSALSCFETDQLPSERAHFISMSLDEAREVPEMDETSNQRINRNLPAGASVDQSVPPPSGQAQADLVVAAIRINGKDPSVNDACKDGKNDVTVTVKNTGTANAASSIARLIVDDTDDAKDRNVPALNAGTEQEVRFDDIRLKKGDRELLAIADAKMSVAESNEGNNERKVTARCKDDD